MRATVTDFEASELQSRRRSKRVSGLESLANPVQGVRAYVARSTWLAWGASSLVTGGTGLTRPATGRQNPAVRSVTMKGPKGLASNFDGRRCRSAKNPLRRVEGSLSVLPL